ncbi:MAG TPA: CehA/McbA family metallohydrolase [Vicinamibacterales bacterium]|nr:CehA/McbA family metallohydrolase [Vicinamibacterales bacterium]
MRRLRIAAVGVFVAAVTAGALLDARRPASAPDSLVLAADLHVHPFPGDGALPVWELRREARRRGIDVIGITGHNNQFGLRLDSLVGASDELPIVLPGQEVTSPDAHMIALGIDHLIDWRLPVRDAIAAIQAQGGVAIAAHPTSTTWHDADGATFRALDGAEIVHRVARGPHIALLRGFFGRVQAVNPDMAPIGSSDFHVTAPLGLCRTYLLVERRSAAGALDAIRRGRTVARDPDGRLFGAAAHVEAVENHLTTTSRSDAVSGLDKLLALGALLSLGALVVVTQGGKGF